MTLGINTSSTNLVSAAQNIQTSNGFANFANSPVDFRARTYRLKAVATSTGVTGLSDVKGFQVATDVKGCDDTLCTNSGSVTLQKGYNQITTTGDFFNGTTTNVLLRMQFLGAGEFPTGAQSTTNGCGPSTALVNQGQEALPEGAGVVDTAPTTTMLIVISKDYLKAKGISARSATAFDICVGAKWIGGGTAPANGWVGHDSKGKPFTTKNDGTGAYWAFANDCTATSGINPCVAVRTKQAADVTAYMKTVDTTWTAARTTALMKDSDLAFIVRKRPTWDGKGGVYAK